MDRRDFIRTSVVAGAAAAASRRARGAPADAARTRIARLDELRPGAAKLVHYPDAASPVFLIRLGRAVAEGAGPRKDLVAYSAVCTHRGCQLDYRGARLVCPCHYSTFDPAAGGATYQGVATEDLPRVRLEVDDGHVFATGIEGLVWGRVKNP